MFTYKNIKVYEDTIHSFLEFINEKGSIVFKRNISGIRTSMYAFNHIVGLMRCINMVNTTCI